MQKEARETDSKRSIREKTGSKSVVGNIFRTMAYNENQVENFSTISSWLSSNQDVISSLINGKSVDLCSKKTKMTIGGKVVSVAFLDGKCLESLLTSSVISQDRGSEKDSGDDKGARERLGKFEELMKTLIADLCVAESIATQVPSWQIREYDQPAWNFRDILSNDISSFADVRRVMHGLWEDKKAVHAIMRLNKESYRLRNVLSLLIPTMEFDGKFTLTISLSSAQDASCVLPTAYLIDALNKSKIRKSPIDLLLIEHEKATVETLLKKHTDGTLYLGNIEDCASSSGRVITGAITPVRASSRHEIVDSSADLQSVVESIATETWGSGTRVNLRARTLLFVHLPIYKTVIEYLDKKIHSQKISSDSTHKSIDFTTRTFPCSIDSKKLLADGVKILPPSANGSSPMVVYDIGTSSDLVANTTPGLGHVLCVIPYRSNAELFSLANNHGPNVQTRIHASNYFVAKEIAANIKGEEIWVNSSGKYNGEEGLGNINNWVFFLPSDTKTTLCSPSEGKQDLLETGKDEFWSGVVLGAEKSMKPWLSIHAEKRSSIGERVLLSVLNNEFSIGESDRVRYLIDLMRIAGQPFNNGYDNDLKLLRTKPIGIVAIVLVNPEKMSVATLILSILSATLKGNAAIVISVSSSIPQPIVETCNSNFPVGLVNFIRSSSVTDSFKRLSRHCGKVRLVWLVHGQGNEGSRVDQIPFTPFTTVIVDHEDFIRPSSSFVPTSLQTSKIIHW